MNCLGSEPETSSGVAIGVIVIILVVVIVIILVIGECVLARDWPHANRDFVVLQLLPWYCSAYGSSTMTCSSDIAAAACLEAPRQPYTVCNRRTRD